ncbi:GMC family oxidoreductase [Candidatus Magnetomorum sp. HK-1]|nr:GMC family oxidoreductase [Candidatus Magnetomorum sp. HK-1]
MKKYYDIIIVGSGAGGGTVAQALIPLVKKGLKVAILEQGPHYPHSYYTQREIEMMRLFRFNGAWPVTSGEITIAAGQGVGGSTLMYTGVSFRLPASVVHEWNVPGLTIEDLNPRFERIEKDINVITPSEKITNENNQLFKKGCESLGWPVKKIPLNIKNCEQMGFCNLGCSSGSKQGTLEVQIPEAIKHGVHLIPNCEVLRISEKKIHAKVQKTPKGTLQGPWKPGNVTIAAKIIVLAAGSPGTSGLLLKSGFQKKLPRIGRDITLHPAMTLYGVYPKPIINYRGFPKTFYTDQFSESHDYYIETAFYYPFVSSRHLGLWGKDLVETMSKYNQLMTVLILNHDTTIPENRISIGRKGAVCVHYRLSKKVINSLCHAQIQSARLFFEAGCDQVIMPCASSPVIHRDKNDLESLKSLIQTRNFIPIKTPVSSAHPQGGCCMGETTEESVTNSWGQVHGYPWLFVADASLFPKSAHVNPYLTVMALADRVAEGITHSQSDDL